MSQITECMHIMIVYVLSPIIPVNKLFPIVHILFLLFLPQFRIRRNKWYVCSMVLNRWKETSHTHGRRLTYTKDITIESLNDLITKAILNCIAVWLSLFSSPLTCEVLSRPKGCNKSTKRHDAILLLFVH